MRTTLMISVAYVVLGLLAPAAFAQPQSEDEKILDQGSTEATPKQSRADDELDDEGREIGRASCRERV